MAAITDLATLAHTDLAVGDWLVVHDLSAATDKKMAPFAAGTWTPALNFGGATTGITYSVQVGTYTKIGRIVLLAATIVLSSKGTATGSATITGLPFTSLTNANSHFYAGTVYWRSMAANGYSIMAILPDNSAAISLYVSSASANTVAATDANFGNTSEIILTMMYEAA